MTRPPGLLAHPAAPASTAEAPVVVPRRRDEPAGAVLRRSLWASTTFAVRALLMAAMTLLLVDWVLFDTPVVAPRLPVSDIRLPSNKLLLASRYLDARVLYLGDSRILHGVDPAVVSQTCGCGPGYNGAFAAADPRLTRIMADQLLRTLSPQVVVIGVSQWELSDEADVRLDRPAMALVPPWRLAEFDVNLSRTELAEATIDFTWRLYRYRGELRAAFAPSAATAPPVDPRRGFGLYDGPRRVREQDLDARQRQWFRDFSVRGRRAEALAGLLDDLRERGIRVMLVAPPLHDNFRARVRREVDTFRAAVEQLAAERGALFDDLTTSQPIGLTRDDFQDVVHLTEPGTIKLSRYLSRIIRSHVDLAP